VAVVETGSIVAAATRLNLTQPGVTRRIRSLEEALGTQLLDRSVKPIQPTASGRKAVELSRQVLLAVNDLRDGVNSAQEPTGEFRIGLVPTQAGFFLRSLIDRLSVQFPKMAVRISSAWSPDLLSYVQRVQLDAAAVWLPEGVNPPPELEAENLGSQAVQVIVARETRLPHPLTLQTLASLPWILSQDGCGFRQSLRRLLEKARVPFAVAVETPDTEVRLSLIARGAGFGLVTEDNLRNSPWKSSIRVVRVPQFYPKSHCWLVQRSSAERLRRPIEALRAALLEDLPRTKKRVCSEPKGADDVVLSARG
jgi:DNA-binding transcriptional LysR family regulator